jgi:hypothetical protein
MADALRRRGFEVDVCTGDRATREGILAGYDSLIARARTDRPAVFYYSGHGFWAISEAEPSIFCQGIQTADRGATTDDDFRGITSWELSIKQTELTRQTRNVTVILDCCFASQMSRDDPDKPGEDPVVRALPHPVRRGFAAHLEALRAKYGADFAAVDARSNPDAVRLVACGQDECAVECTVDGASYGALTAALLAALREVGNTPVCWASILASIQSWVGHWVRVQHPGIEGPVRRRLFSLDEDHGSEVVPITALANGFQVGAGKISRVTVGDVYAVMPFGSRTYASDRAIGRVRISAVSGTTADAVVLASTGVETALSLPAGSVALPIERRAAPYPVQIDIPHDAWPAVTEAIAANPLLRIAVAEEASELPRLCITEGQVTLQDGFRSLGPPVEYPDDLHGVVQALANLAVACSLRDLAGEHGVLASEIDLAWGTVDGGTLRQVAEHGGSLAPGNRIYVRVTRRTDRPLYVHVFELGCRGTITLCTNYAHTGEALTDDRPECMLGRDARGAVIGFELGTLDAQLGDASRTAELIVIVTDAPADLRRLETVDPVAGLRGLDAERAGSIALPGSSDTGQRSLVSREGFLVTHLSVELPPFSSEVAQRIHAAAEARGL